jgi:hypothetical protein
MKFPPQDVSCMLFCASVGANEVVTDAVTEKPVGKGEQHGKQPKAPVPALKSFFSKSIQPEKPMPKANEQPLPVSMQHGRRELTTSCA